MKQAFRTIERSRIFREVFNDEASTRKNGGVPTDVVWQDGKGVFNGSSSKVEFPSNYKGEGTVRIKFNLDNLSASQMFFEGRASASNGNVYVYALATSGALTKANIDNIFVNNVDINTVSVGDNEVILLLSSTAELGQIRIGGNYVNATYISGSVDFIELYDRQLTAEEVSLLYKGRYNRKPVSTQKASFASFDGVDDTIELGHIFENSLTGYCRFDVMIPTKSLTNQYLMNVEGGTAHNPSIYLTDTKLYVVGLGATMSPFYTGYYDKRVTIELEWSVTTGNSKLKINGTQVASTLNVPALTSADVNIGSFGGSQGRLKFTMYEIELVSDSQRVILQPYDNGTVKDIVSDTIYSNGGTGSLGSDYKKLLLDLDTTKGYLKPTTGDNRENMFTNSEVFADWYKQGSPIVVESDVEPFVLGGYADKVTTAYPNYIRPNPLPTHVIGNRYKASHWIKNVDSPRVILWARTAVNSYYLNVDFSGSEISSLGLTVGESATYEDLGNGWYRIDIIYEALESVTYNRIYPSPTSGNTYSIFVARVQLQRMEVDGEYVVTPGDDEKQAIILTPTDIDFKKIGTNYALEANGSTTQIDCGTDFIGIKDVTVVIWAKLITWGNLERGYFLSNGKLIIFISESQFATKALCVSCDGLSVINSTANTLSLNKDYCIFVTISDVVNIYIGDQNTPPSLKGSANQNAGTRTAGSYNTILYNNDLVNRGSNSLTPKLTIFEGILSLEEITNYWSSTRKQIG